jgi:NAD(P)-dependent dehydrogenase (short-subunit alcohol dehydrogenase family)
MKHAVVSGANAGIGFATTKALLEQGFKVSMFCRNQQKAEEAKATLIAETKNDHLDIFIVDFESLKSIESGSQKFKLAYDTLDVLVNNAGATFADFQLSEDGIERTMAVNHFGYFALTYHLWSLLDHKGARIINVASKSHFGGNINFENINSKESYSVYNQYEHSKLANVLFSKYLSSKVAIKGITVNCLHPGVVKTRIGHKSGNKFFGFIWSIMSSFGLSLDEGAATSVYLAVAPEVSATSGMYFDKCIAYEGSKLSNDENLQDNFWKWSEEKSDLNWVF